MISLLRKSVVPIYRVFSLASLYTVLIGILAYGAIFTFYLGSTAWVAPFQVNSSDAQVLAITSQVVQSQTSLDALRLDYAQTRDNLKFSREQLADFLGLSHQLSQTVRTQKVVWNKSATDLGGFDSETQSNIRTLTKDVGNGADLRASVERDLEAGLITKSDAQKAIMDIDTLANTTTGTKVSESLLVDSIRQHQMVDISGLTVDAEVAQVQFQISQLETAIVGDEQRLASDAATINNIETALSTAVSSPLYRAVNSTSAVQLAVAPYDSNNVFKTGEPVYECALGLMFCRNVGKVVAVYPNELIFENPLSKSNTRGYVLELQVKQTSMRSKSLVVGHKPLGI